MYLYSFILEGRQTKQIQNQLSYGQIKQIFLKIIVPVHLMRKMVQK